MQNADSKFVSGWLGMFRQSWPFVLFALLAVGIQMATRATETEFKLTQLTMALYYALVVLGLSLLMGYAGQVSLGHGAFFAAGGYTTAVLTTHDFSHLAGAGTAWFLKARMLTSHPDLYGNTVITAAPWAAFLAAMAVTLVLAITIGYPALRLRGHYLAMATLGFGLIISKVLVGTSVFGSADGINGVPEWKLPLGLVVSGKGAARVQNYYVACFLVLGTLVVLRNIVRSRVGRALMALHEREVAAGTLGINTSGYKLKVFVISALLAAMGGVFFTHYTGGIGPSEAGALKSVRYVALAAAGGMANLWGVTAASVLLNYLSLRGVFGTYDNAVFGLVLILIIALAPDGPLKGLFPRLKALFTRKSNRRHPHVLSTQPVTSTPRAAGGHPRSEPLERSTIGGHS